ncbi:MAG: hypothetical protein ACXVA9_04115 [Bdellovibrionales bacterium]
MAEKLQLLLKEIQNLEMEVENELHRVSEKVNFSVKGRKIIFTQEILKLHRSLRKGIAKFLIESNFLFVLTAPVIYSLIVPAVVLEIFCRTFQAICFPVYGIPKVNRADFIRLDRHRLAYLNGIEKFNCDYCSYFNGVLAYAREIGSRTEQYWCPIRHALAVKGVHRRYNQFLDFGDADSYHSRLNQLRKQLADERN